MFLFHTLNLVRNWPAPDFHGPYRSTYVWRTLMLLEDVHQPPYFLYPYQTTWFICTNHLRSSGIFL